MSLKRILTSFIILALFLVLFIVLKWSYSSSTTFPILADTNSNLPSTITVNIEKSGEVLKFEFVRIPPGSLKMGRNKDVFAYLPFVDVQDGFAHPSFHATITKGYYIGKDNINTTQFSVFLNTLSKEERYQYANLETDNLYLQYKNEENIKIIGNDNEPVKTVSWLGSVAFCEWLSTISTMKFYLPTEAEWELAARGNGNIYDSVYNSFLSKQGSFSPPGPVTPNGLQGLATGSLGNWVSDYAGYFTSEPKTDPKGANNAIEDNCHILKRPMHSIAGRSSNYLARKDNGIYGFRVVLNEDSVSKFIEHPELLPKNISIQVQ
ncbi:MAG: formylglycine-generating enzyme family protein [Planctomycetaceae bacterium]|jgi:hypothetical protein|nr:formylglycine-generating enzyme family protein [Planctomycetaceae bacterium]